jgi:hypothetical protein
VSKGEPASDLTNLLSLIGKGPALVLLLSPPFPAISTLLIMLTLTRAPS